jgi:hypothetical protein
MNIAERSRSSVRLALAVSAAGLLTPILAAEKALPPATFNKLPITEVTVFKDGHAFIAHDGQMPTDEHGNVVLDYLPARSLAPFGPTRPKRRPA